MGMTKNGGGNLISVASDKYNTRNNLISPPSSSPAECVKIAPENLEVANSYLACQSIPDVSRNLGLPTDVISSILARREVRAYMDAIFLDYGFNNRFKMRNIMDAVINKKLTEMDESDLGSGKDIIEIMALSHKMAMDVLDRQIKLAEAEAKTAGIKNQVNVQVNNAEGSKYDNLIQRLMSGGE